MPPDTPDAIRPVVVCPLEFERRALDRVGLSDQCELQCAGHGSDRIAEWGRDQPRGPRTVILAGLAGSLCGDRPAGSAWWISEVINPASGRRWQPSLPVAAADPTSIVSTDASIVSPLERFRQRTQTGAELIDLESARFAAVAARRGWRWGIVRGVSDDFSVALPHGVDQWVQADGRTAYSVVMRSLLLKPKLLPLVLELRRHSTAAMEAVARLIAGHDEIADGGASA
ncbi:MAG: nucleoside phosphorylase-I family protein [Planctomycetota bacterium]|jgi:hypothetical protein